MMGRPKSQDPAIPLTITLPKSVKRFVMGLARSEKTTTSALILKLIRNYREARQIPQ